MNTTRDTVKTSNTRKLTQARKDAGYVLVCVPGDGREPARYFEIYNPDTAPKRK